ncbi:MAG: hypothetical protein ACTHM2_11140 [Afipia sp.]
MRTLVFAPHSAFWIHAFPEALVADALRGAGHEIVYVTCGEAFGDWCVPMAANKLTLGSTAGQRAEVCRVCRENEGILRKGFAFKGPNLADVLTAQDLLDIEAVLSQATRETIETLEVDGVPIGKIALYQVVLRYKRVDTNFNESEWEYYLADLRNALLALRVGGRLIDQHKPDRVLVYNGLYAVNHAVCSLAESRGIPAYFAHAGPNFSRRLQSLIVARGQSFSYMPKMLKQWPRFADVPCTARQLRRATDHLLELLRGKSIFAYSPQKTANHFDARTHFGVKAGQKLVVATLSSNDEYAAGILVGAQKPWGELLFASQIEWVRDLVEFAKRRPDIFLVVRVHPREFPNRRDGQKSQHAHEMERMFVSLPENAAVNWPADGISIYDLADQTDVFLNAWSSVGKEMTMLGIPVVIYSRELPLYPSNINYLGETHDDYFAAIDRALKDGWSLERARATYRWAVYETLRATIDVSDSYSEVENPVRSIPQKALHRIKRNLMPNYVQYRDVKHRSSELAAAPQISKLFDSAAWTTIEHVSAESCEQDSLENETAALRVELQRLADALYPTAEARRASQLYGKLSRAFA